MPAFPTIATFTTGQVGTAAKFTTLADAATWQHTPPCCRVYNSALISIASGGSGTALTFNSERYDTDTMHSTSTNTGRITFTQAGKYNVTGLIAWTNSNTTGVRQAQIRVNGTTLIAVDSMTGASDQQGVSADYQFAAADYVELVAYQNSSVSLNVSLSSNYSPEFMAHWICA